MRRLALVLLLSSIASSAVGQAALVEDAKAQGLGVEFMDYVQAGQVIKLGVEDELVLGYLRSCWRESIKGGTVTVGTDESKVEGGEVRREKVRCDGGQLRLTQAQSGQSAVMVFRAPGAQTTHLQPHVTLFGLSPVLEVRGGGTVTIERLDQPGRKLTVDVVTLPTQRGAYYDLAKRGQELVAGGLYLASAGPGREILFKIDAEATPGQAPIVSRLLRL